MKNFKEIRSTLNEEYYTGPTAFSGSDRTNVGDIAGSDLGSFANGGNVPYAKAGNTKQIENAFNVELAGSHADPVAALTVARTKLNITGLSYDIIPKDVRMSVESGADYTVPLNFYGRQIGMEKDPADEFASSEIGDVGTPRAEESIEVSQVTFTFTPRGAGYAIKAMFS